MKFGKKFWTAGVAFALAATLVACGGGTGSSGGSGGGSSGGTDQGQQVFEFNINNYNPSTHQFAVNVYEPWAKYVEEKSNGRIKATLYNGATLGSSTTFRKDVAAGVSDVGLFLPDYYLESEFFPSTIATLPFAFSGATPETATKIMKQFTEKYLLKDLNKDMHYLGGVVVTEASDLYARIPIRSLEDFKGKTFHGNGQIVSDLVTALGGTPVGGTFEEIYEGLSKGTMDGAFFSASGGVTNKVYEVGPYLTRVGVVSYNMIPVLGQPLYDRMPADLQKLVDEDLGPKLIELFIESYKKVLAADPHKQIADLVGNKGEVISLPEDELQKLRLAAKPVWDKWQKQAEEKGFPAQEMMDTFKQLLKEEGIVIPF